MTGTPGNDTPLRKTHPPGEFLPVRLYPEPERGIVDIEFTRHLGDRPRVRGGEESTTFLTACSLNSGV